MIPSSPPLRLPVTMLAACAILSACSLAPEPEAPAPVEVLPEAFREAPDAEPADYEPLRWWESFEDPALSALVDTVLASNLDIMEAVGRVLESRAQLGVATADLLPQVNGNADASRASNPTNAGFGQQIGAIIGGDTTSTPDPDRPQRPDRFTITDYSVSLGASYELDFWGRARNDRSAAARDLEASDADLQAAVVGVISETVTAWFQAADLQRRVELNEEIVQVLEDRVALTQSRYDRGLVTSFELYQVRQDLQNTRAALPALRNQRADARGRLAVLAGRYPGDMDALLADLSLPRNPLSDIPATVPTTLLWQRPDVRAAGRRLEAARLRVGARRAELLPRLTLSGSLGLQSAQADGWLDLDQWFSNLAAGLVAPLFQGGRLRANVRAARARLQQQTAVYGRAVLTAVVETENALSALREEESRLNFFQAQLQEAESSVNLQSSRYRSGVTGYADYLDALRNELTARSALASSARDYALARLAVHRALGGSWIEADAVDAIAELYPDAPTDPELQAGPAGTDPRNP